VKLLATGFEIYAARPGSMKPLTDISDTAKRNRLD
jgi:hypothetical protein